MDITTDSDNNATIHNDHTEEASMEGSATTLNLLMEKDKPIQSKVSLTAFSETPLHISALLGHTCISQTLLVDHPDLAFCLDSRGRTPLHLGSASGHVDTVRVLLGVRKQFIDKSQQHKDMCLAKDGDGRTALHYAAMSGHVAVVELLVDAQPRAVFEEVPVGETMLHLCVRYYQLETLKMLVRSVLVSASAADVSDLINTKEPVNGSTVLDLAVMLNQIQTVEYLLSVCGLKQDTLNHKDLKASELVDVDHLQRDHYNTHILKLIMAKNNIVDDVEPRMMRGNKFLSRVTSWLDTVRKAADRVLQSEQMRGSFLVVAGLIAQTTFQMAFNPPGGVWQQTITADPTGQASCSERVPCIAGTSVLADIWPNAYLVFLQCNTLSFLTSLSVILLVVGGFPITNKFCAWLMTAAVFFTLTFTALTYLEGMIMVAPSNEDVYGPVVAMLRTSFWIWFSLIAILGFVHTVFFLVLLLKKLYAKIIRRRSDATMLKDTSKMVDSTHVQVPITRARAKKIKEQLQILQMVKPKDEVQSCTKPINVVSAQDPTQIQFKSKKIG